MSNGIEKIEYGPQARTGFMVAALFLTGLIASLHYALNNDQGLIISGIIQLSEKSANIYYWAITAGMACFFLLGLYVWIAAFLGPKKYIEITHNSFKIPGVFFKDSKSLYFSEIRRIQQSQKGKTKFILISTLHGSTSCLSSYFRNEDDFQQFLKIILQKTSH